MLAYFFNRPLPPGLEGLAELALDLRWTWSHFSDRLWSCWIPMHGTSQETPTLSCRMCRKLVWRRLPRMPTSSMNCRVWLAQRQRYLQSPCWYGREQASSGLKGVAYFSMEFGLGEALPVYSGGLGILAGDYLKTASDLGVPVVGIGLLYQQGYFRQTLDPDGRQQEAFPDNDPMSLPVMPVQTRQGDWLTIRLELPGRSILVRVWQAQVGRVTLYLLDSNHLLNSPADRGATAMLYPSGEKTRLTQEIILGVGGWQVLEELGHDSEIICHLNEGHAALAVLAHAHAASCTARNRPSQWRCGQRGSVMCLRPIRQSKRRLTGFRLSSFALMPPISRTSCMCRSMSF